MRVLVPTENMIATIAEVEADKNVFIVKEQGFNNSLLFTR